MPTVQPNLSLENHSKYCQVPSGSLPPLVINLNFVYNVTHIRFLSSNAFMKDRGYA